MRLAIFEILEQTAKLKTKQEKIEFLNKHHSTALATILRFGLDPSIKWLLPEGEVPYKPNPMGDENHLIADARRLYLYIEGGNPNLKQTRRETLFIELLENCHPKDAALIVALKDKKMPYKGITATLINEAFPGLIPDGQDK